MSSKKRNASAATIGSATNRLAEFGFLFVNDRLVQAAEHAKSFKFVNQKHYDELASIVADVVAERMTNECGGLQSLLLGDNDECPMFVSPGVAQTDDVVVLVHGSNSRAGLWSRRLVINDSLSNGSMLPYIQRCLTAGYGVVVLNHSIPFVAAGVKVDNGLSHVEYVWDHVLRPRASHKFGFISHSFGGTATLHMLLERHASLLPRVSFVAFTDSAHNLLGARNAQYAPVKAFLASAACTNWVRSTAKLDKPLGTKSGVRAVSAGTEEHERCSCQAIDVVLAFVALQFARRHVAPRVKANGEQKV